MTEEIRPYRAERHPKVCVICRISSGRTTRHQGFYAHTQCAPKVKRLIAAAPRMLKLIREVSQWVEGEEVVNDALAILRDVDGDGDTLSRRGH